MDPAPVCANAPEGEICPHPGETRGHDNCSGGKFWRESDAANIVRRRTLLKRAGSDPRAVARRKISHRALCLAGHMLPSGHANAVAYAPPIPHLCSPPRHSPNTPAGMHRCSSLAEELLSCSVIQFSSVQSSPLLPPLCLACRLHALAMELSPHPGNNASLACWSAAVHRRPTYTSLTLGFVFPKFLLLSRAHLPLLSGTSAPPRLAPNVSPRG